MKTGIYIHVPFCRSKCAYCSFVSIPWDDLLAERYWRAVIRELQACARISSTTHTVDTIYFGGGTPSLLPVGHIAAMLDACRGIFNVEPECEISLEANPGTLAAEKLLVYQGLGVNRISLGAQSFFDEELTAVGRIHTVSQIGESARLLRDCGFQNVNFDLILGLPGQTDPNWVSSLESAVALAPAHLSVYMLELDSKVPLYRSMTAGHCQVPDEDSVADAYLYAIHFLESHGYFQYEISNFSRRGCECRHNLKYWQRKPVLAFGVAAHSHDGTSRYANVSNLIDYLSAVEEGRSPRAWRESLDSTRELEETIFLGLRLNRGLDWDQVRRTYEADRLEPCEASLKELAGMGLLRWSGSMVQLTHRGMLLSNEVFQMFVHLRNTCEEQDAGRNYRFEE